MVVIERSKGYVGIDSCALRDDCVQRRIAESDDERVD